MLRRLRDTSRHVIRANGLTWLLAVIGVVAGQSPAAAGPTLDELVAGIARQRAAFHAQTSYKFDFEVESQVYRGKQTWVYKKFRVADIRRGAEMSTTAFIPAGALYDQPDLPEHIMRRIWYRDAAIDTNNSFTEIAPRILIQHHHFHQYTDYQHINIYEDLPEPTGNIAPYEISQPFLPETIERNRASYHVRPDAEPIEGTECWVIERAGVDLIWVDSDGLIRKRQLHYAQGEPRSVITVLTDYEEVVPGLKLPRKIFVQHFTNPKVDPAEILDQLSYELTIVLTDYAFNSVKDEDFLYAPPQGSVVNDYIRRVQYRVPVPGEQPFEQALQIASLEQPGKTQVLFLVNGVLLGLLLIVILWRRIARMRGSRQASSTPSSSLSPDP